MLEGLIEFSCKFAITPEDDVNIVTMEKNTWVFYQCEPEIWIVCGISNKPTRISSSVAPMGHVGSPTVVGSRYSSPTKAKDNVSFHKQIPNGAGLLVAIKVSRGWFLCCGFCLNQQCMSMLMIHWFYQLLSLI